MCARALAAVTDARRPHALFAELISRLRSSSCSSANHLHAVLMVMRSVLRVRADLFVAPGEERVAHAEQTSELLELVLDNVSERLEGGSSAGCCYANVALLLTTLRHLLSQLARVCLDRSQGTSREKQVTRRETLAADVHYVLLSLEPFLLEFICEELHVSTSETSSGDFNSAGAGVRGGVSTRAIQHPPAVDRSLLFVRPGYVEFLVEMAKLLLDALELTSRATRTFSVPLNVQLSAEGLLRALLLSDRDELRLVALHYAMRSFNAFRRLTASSQSSPDGDGDGDEESIAALSSLSATTLLSPLVLGGLLELLYSECLTSTDPHPECVSLAADCLSEAAPVAGLTRLLRSAPDSIAARLNVDSLTSISGVRQLLRRTLEHLVEQAGRVACALTRWCSHLFLQYCALRMTAASLDDCSSEELESGDRNKPLCCELLEAIARLTQTDAIANRLAAADSVINLLPLALASLKPASIWPINRCPLFACSKTPSMCC